MLTLAIDTCCFYYSVALLREAQVLFEISSHEQNLQCEELVCKIESLMKKSSLNYRDLDLIAVTSGPGTFNGVRIGMSAAYGISLATGVKIVTVSTLEVMAYKEKATSICFTPDSQVGFLQHFDEKFYPISEISEVSLDRLTSEVLVFDINGYDKSQVSNGVIAGLIAIQTGRKKSTLFYGKTPSIHVKNPG